MYVFGSSGGELVKNGGQKLTSTFIYCTPPLLSPFRQFPCRDLNHITSVGHCSRQPRNAGRWHGTNRSCVRRHLFFVENHGYSAVSLFGANAFEDLAARTICCVGGRICRLRSPRGGNHSFRLIWTNIKRGGLEEDLYGEAAILILSKL